MSFNKLYFYTYVYVFIMFPSVLVCVYINFTLSKWRIMKQLTKSKFMFRRLIRRKTLARLDFFKHGARKKIQRTNYRPNRV